MATDRVPITLRTVLTFDDEKLTRQEAQRLFLEKLPEKLGPVTIEEVEIVEGLIGDDEVPAQPKAKEQKEWHEIHKQYWLQRRPKGSVVAHRRKIMKAILTTIDEEFQKL